MKSWTRIAILLLGVAMIWAHPQTAKAGSPGSMKKKSFGKLADGKEATLYILTNKNGVEVSITDFGATVVSIKTPDRNGNLGDIVAGYESAAQYEDGKNYFGATIGRYGNRIAHGEFSLDGKKYTLAKNNNENHLHGGLIGFNKVLWFAEDASTKDAPAIRLHYVS